jgi:hypothetical protein
MPSEEPFRIPVRAVVSILGPYHQIVDADDQSLCKLPARTKVTEKIVADLNAVPALTRQRDEAVELLREISDAENPEHYGNARDALHSVKIRCQEFLDRLDDAIKEKP